jgi:hypothetical protein
MAFQFYLVLGAPAFPFIYSWYLMCTHENNWRLLHQNIRIAGTWMHYVLNQCSNFQIMIVVRLSVTLIYILYIELNLF